MVWTAPGVYLQDSDAPASRPQNHQVFAKMLQTRHLYPYSIVSREDWRNVELWIQSWERVYRARMTHGAREYLRDMEATLQKIQNIKQLASSYISEEYVSGPRALVFDEDETLDSEVGQILPAVRLAIDHALRGRNNAESAERKSELEVFGEVRKAILEMEGVGK